MFSRRLKWPFPSNRLSRVLDDKRARGADILDLTESNPTRVGLRYPAKAIGAALQGAGAPVYEPAARGLERARAAVAEWHARHERPVAPDRVLLTASTSEAYAFLFKLLADPGDLILVPRPSYPLFDYLAPLEGVRAAAYPLTYDDRWSIDLQALERACAAASPPTAIVVVNPNNPTGSAVRESERARLEEIAARAGAAIISDEVFFEYLDAPGGGGDAPGFGGRAVSLLTHDAASAGPVPSVDSGALKFVLGGLSKSCGLPQLKLAWLIADGPDDRVDEAMERLDLVADTYLSVGTPVQRAAGSLLAIGEEIRAAIRRRLDANLETLRPAVGAASSCRVLKRDGGWSAILQVPAVLPEEEMVLDLLAQDDVLVHPGYFFDFPREAFLVLSLLPDPATFEEALRRILDRVDRR
ncbi:MAG: hypothetical protein AUH92_02255 [Acidobacteria bacterium 13_1_40CM_4_69_4]|nr:MAG: hypothetical protein AUH92_02255 [Acidobacteria bacterium 13_1_40CM_4_69_4]